MKAFNKGSSWFGMIDMSMSLSLTIKGEDHLLTDSWFIPLYAAINTSLTCHFQALFDDPPLENPLVITLINIKFTGFSYAFCDIYLAF